MKTTPIIYLKKPLFHEALEVLGFKLTNKNVTFKQKKLKCAYCLKPVTKKTIDLIIPGKPPRAVCNDPICIFEYFEDHPQTRSATIAVTKRKNSERKIRRKKHGNH